MGSDFGGDDFLSNLLEMQREEVPRRGRPTRLDAATLENRRNVLAGVLETGWGLVGWQLRMTTTVEGIRAALEPISQGRRELSPFTRSPAATVQGPSVREARKRFDECQQASRLEHQRLQPLQEAAQRSAAALHQLRSALRDLERGVRDGGQIQQLEGQIKSMEQEHRVREQHVAEQKERFETAGREEEGAKEQLLDADASFSQAELLRFILSGRYRLIPLNFANAMAGPPDIGWRRSFKRCLRSSDAHTESVAYTQFTIIARAVKSHHAADSSSLEEAIRAYLLRSGAKPEFALLELRKNWYHLRRAIAAVEVGSWTADKIPYRIAARYAQLTQSRSAVDLLREEEERL